MARRKNLQRRRVILNNTFILIKENGLTHVSLQMIADKSHISKSLLQSYYPHKDRLINDIMHNLMSSILRELDALKQEDDVYAKMKVFIYTILELGWHDSGNSRLLDSLFKNSTTLDKWGQLLNDWLKEEKIGHHLGDNRQVQLGLTFVVSGCGNLYLKRAEFNLMPQEISDIMVKTFLSTFLDKKPDEVAKVLQTGQQMIRTLNMGSVHDAINDMFAQGKPVYC